jgi:hypothetical protein
MIQSRCEFAGDLLSRSGGREPTRQSNEKRAPVLAALLISGFMKPGWWPQPDEHFKSGAEKKSDDDSLERPGR